MTTVPSVPIWCVALIAAAVSPVLVRGLAFVTERKSREHTTRVIARALAALRAEARSPRTSEPSEREREPVDEDHGSTSITSDGVDQSVLESDHGNANGSR